MRKLEIWDCTVQMWISLTTQKLLAVYKKNSHYSGQVESIRKIIFDKDLEKDQDFINCKNRILFLNPSEPRFIAALYNLYTFIQHSWGAQSSFIVKERQNCVNAILLLK
mgnify:CR=1 FL=1